MRISDWSSDVCSSDLVAHAAAKAAPVGEQVDGLQDAGLAGAVVADKQVQARAGEEGDLGKAAQTPDLKPGQAHAGSAGAQQNARSGPGVVRSEEHTSELQSLMRNSYAVFCLKKKKYNRDEKK